MSYEQASQDMAYLMGIRVPAKTQQRLVHRQTFALPSIEEPIEELCVDGGVRLRTPLGEACGRDYKAITTESGTIANFQNNAQIIEWMNTQPLSNKEGLKIMRQPCIKYIGLESEIWE